ncbi:unnamed protein product [Cuscuta epithymum]|uniref:Kinesin motor domain-containing protein n=2 Tax=Cuscuta epithymum TaxID=186058 RepID=A0AAV0G386_9ASTE|nr:unnamed protein product [Cuscuta epithymum]
MEVQNADVNSPQTCPKAVTVRRNPHRRARDTPSTNNPPSFLKPNPVRSNNISSFPIQEILSIDVNADPKLDSVTTEEHLPENLKVYLRIRPVVIQNSAGKKAKSGASKLQAKNVWPKNPRAKINLDKRLKTNSNICLAVNDSHSVTLVPPSKLQDTKRTKYEVYEGFSEVFSPEASQKEVYEKMVNPLVDDLLRGKSGMLAALGPSGSGKTHTIFGSVKDPGMVTLALQQLFSEDGDKTKPPRIYHLSMFEICSEKGKSEKIFDLSQDSTDLCIQHTSIKGLHEIRVNDIQQAETIIGRGLLRRATAMTNSNSHSSRSQCIINIRCGHKKGDGEVSEESNGSILTIVDLAGAEREKRTGNKGARLLESNFINNTSMVFGQCLRSLLEHQKNPKKPLQKHFQNSMLTRYLRDYLEGKKRMALLLTARAEREDYIDTSFLLRQASPYTKIKFDCIEEPLNLNCNKRARQTVPMSDQIKRMKMGDIEALKPGRVKMGQDSSLIKEEHIARGVDDKKLIEASIHSEQDLDGANVNDRFSAMAVQTNIEGKDRQYQVLLGFSKALWKLLKDYKKKLEVAENDIYCLREELKDLKIQHSSKTEDCQPTVACKLGKTLQDSKLEDTKMESTSLECGSTNVMVTLCQSNDQKGKNPIERTDTILVEHTANSSLHDEGMFVESPEDPKLEHVEVEDTLLEFEPEKITTSCQCSVQEDENSEGRTDSELVGPTANSPLHDEGKFAESPEDPKLEHVEVEDTSLEFVPEKVITSCPCSGQEDENSKGRTDSEFGGPTANSPLHDERKVLLFEEQFGKSLEDSKLEYLEEEDAPLQFGTPKTMINLCNSSVKEDKNSNGMTDTKLVEPTANSPLHEERKFVESSQDPNVEDVKVGDNLECGASKTMVNSCQSSDQEEKPLYKRTCDSILVEPTDKFPLQYDDVKKHLHPRVPNPESNALEVVPKQTSFGYPKIVEKPKRRLQPASSILLKDIGNVDFVDDNEKVKGTKAERKSATINVRNISDGSVSLLRLLTDQFH